MKDWTPEEHGQQKYMENPCKYKLDSEGDVNVNWIRIVGVVLLFMIGELEQTLLRDGFPIVEAKFLGTSISSRIP